MMCMCTFLPVRPLSSITTGIDITAGPIGIILGMTLSEGLGGFCIIEFLS